MSVDTPEPTGGVATLEPPAKPTSLRPVLQAIPASCYENPTWRGLFAVARDFAVYFTLLFLLTRTDNPLLLVPLWAAMGLVVSGLFVLGHDAAHQALFSSSKLNGIIGRICFIPSFHVFDGWVFGHNRVHHGHTVKEGFDFVWHPLTPEQYATLTPINRLRHRMEWSWLGSGLYYGRDVWWNKMMSFDPPERWRKGIVRDRRGLVALVSVIVALVAVAGYGAYDSVLGAVWLPVKLLVIPFLLFLHIIGWTVHVHHIDPDIVWYRRREWDKFKAQVEGTTVLHARPWANAIIHNIFVHVPHHVDMRIPYYHLPEAADAIKAAYPGMFVERKLRIRDHFHNTSLCKLYDFDEHRWLTYEEAAPRIAAATGSPSSPAPSAA